VLLSVRCGKSKQPVSPGTKLEFPSPRMCCLVFFFLFYVTIWKVGKAEAEAEAEDNSVV